MALFLWMGVLLLPGWAYAAQHVLILNSYHRGKALSDDTIDAIVTDFKLKHPEVTFLIEDMDTKRHKVKGLMAPLVSFYAEKYREIELCAVVTVDNNAFDFAVEHRGELFPNVPIIFCGFNGFQPSVLEGVEAVTGVAEAIDIESTVTLALALHPNVSHLAVVSDSTPSGTEILEEFRRYAPEVPSSIKLVELAGLTGGELAKRLGNLPSSSVVLRLSFFRDAAGQSYTVDEQAEILAAPGLPVYDFWDEAIGAGYVGGYVLTGDSQGRLVASMLDRLLSGEPIQTISVVERSPNIPVFDKRQLLRTKADLSQLPPNAFLRYDDVSFWERNRRLLIGISGVFALLLGLAIFFAILSFQRKRHANALAFEEQKLRATFQSIGEGVVTTNAKGEIEQMNLVAEHLLGLPPADVVGRQAHEFFHGMNGSPDPVCVLAEQGHLAPRDSGLLMTSSGESLPIVRTVSPLAFPRANEGGTVIVFRDMTRENELQTELENVRKLEALGQLAGGVAHDFNNLLCGIVGAAELVREEVESEDLNELTSLILESSAGAAELTGQLLSFARKQPVAWETVHVHEIIDDTLAVLRRTIDKRIEMEVHAKATQDAVLGDRTLLQACFLNLGINASHAMPSGGTLRFVTRDIILSEEQAKENSFDLVAGQYIEVRVEDVGSGIEPDVLDRIFEPFFTTKVQGKGTGLGLAAVFGTVQQHEGSVAVESELGIGTTFTICLPLTEQDIRRPLGQDRSIRGEGVVLVVEDQDSVRLMAQRNLEHLGYDVLTATNGLEALEVYRQENGRIDVVLLDMIMPKMNGRDCFEQLKQINPEICIIVTSGYSNSQDLEAVRGGGAAVYLPKPYKRAQLSQAVSEAFNLRNVGRSSTP